MNDMDDLQDMYQFDSRRANAPKAPVPQSMPPASRFAPNVASLPPSGAKAPKHVLDAGMRDDIDHELEDDFTSNRPIMKNVPEATTNASPPRRDIMSGSSIGSTRDHRRKAPETRDRPQHPPVDSNSFAPSEQATNNPVDIAPMQ